MCEPMSVMSAAMMAASVVANKVGADAQQSARSSANAAEMARQQDIRKQSGDLFDVTLDKARAPTQIAEQAAMADARNKKDSATLDANRGVYGTGNASLDGESKSAIARSLSSALTRGKQQARANANVNGFGDQTAKMGIELGRAGQWQNIFAGDGRASSSLLQGELEEANGAGAGARGAGQLLGVGSQAAGAYGMTGKAPTWGDMFGGGKPGGTSPAAMIAPRGTTSAGWFA